MPPIENELAESDFDDAVTTCLYLAEAERDRIRSENLAIMIANKLARILAPLWGGEVKEPGEPLPWEVGGARVNCNHEFGDGDVCAVCGEKLQKSSSFVGCEHDYLSFNDGYMKCSRCDHLKQKRHFEEQAKCDGHEIVDGVCSKCGGYEIGGSGLVTQGLPRII